MNQFSFAELLAMRKAAKEAQAGQTDDAMTSSASKPPPPLPPLPDLDSAPTGEGAAIEVAAIKKDVLRLR